MKKNVLAVSIAAMIGGLGFAGVASAGNVISNAAYTAGPLAAATDLAVNPDGVGHILLVPYFSTQNGNVSLLNITNTDQVNGKAVKLRYRGAANSDDIYDITLLLSPGDMWSANVSNNGGISALTTNDNSCTLPAAVNADFSTVRVRDENPTETLEGYIEILNVADIPKFLMENDGSATTTANGLYTAIKHVAGTPKCATIPDQTANVEALVAGPTFGGSNAANERGYAFPTGGLMANWSIVNLSKAGSFTGEATAIFAHDGAKVNAAGNIVFSPQDEVDQDTAVMAIGELTADPLLAGGVDAAAAPVAATIAAKNYDFPDLSTPYVTTPGAGAALAQAETLSGALATLSVTNEYMTSADVGFATDWTFSMPSRRYNVALDYAGKQAVYANGGTYFTADNAKINSAKTQICVAATYNDLAYFDTSEQSKAAGGYVISPQPAGAGLQWCGETSVLAFNLADWNPASSPTAVLGATIARQNIKTVTATKSSEVYTDGWMSIKTPNGPVGSELGLPIIGHAFVKALGSGFNLGGIWKHRTDLLIK